MNRLGIILLAAGASRRMGSPKQLLEIDGVPLVKLACDRLVALRPAAMCVVLGSEADKVRAALAGTNADCIENERWSEGMGTSIACGVTHLRDREIDGLLITLCDQPAIPIEHYESLWRRFVEVMPEIVATEYRGASGVPVIFARSLFEELAGLQGDRGAKVMFRDPARRVQYIVCESAGIDLDTVSDVEAFRSIK